MADNDKSPDPEIAQISGTPLTAERREIQGHNPNHDKPTLGLPPGSDILSPTQLKELFAEWRADYEAARDGHPTPPVNSANIPDIDIDR